MEVSHPADLLNLNTSSIVSTSNGGSNESITSTKSTTNAFHTTAALLKGVLYANTNNNNNNSSISIQMQQQQQQQQTNIKYYSLEEVKKHNKRNDLWTVIHNNVYDLTRFFDEHPGGDIIMEAAGKDSTYLFEDIGHSNNAYVLLEKYFIGKLIVEPTVRKSKFFY